MEKEKCRVCGRMFEKHKMVDDCAWPNSRDKFMDLPPIFLKICKGHVYKFFKWHSNRKRDEIPTETDLAIWVGEQIKIIAKRLEDGKVGGYCECSVNGGRSWCMNYASVIVDGLKVCDMHLKSKDRGCVISGIAIDEHPITKIAMNLLNS